MSHDDVTIDGMRAAYGRPEGDGPFPGVVVLHDIAGLMPDTRRAVERLAAAGYVTVAPDLYSGSALPKPVCVAQTVFDMVRGGVRTNGKVELVRRWLTTAPEVVGRKVGVLGFCMGGGFAMTAAVKGDFAASSVNYGAVPKSVDDVRGACPVVGSFAGDDRLFRGHPDRLISLLDELGVEHDVKVYPGVGHGFMNDHRGTWVGKLVKAYDQDAADDAWRRILAFFATHLD